MNVPSQWALTKLEEIDWFFLPGSHLLTVDGSYVKWWKDIKYHSEGENLGLKYNISKERHSNVNCAYACCGEIIVYEIAGFSKTEYLRISQPNFEHI